MIFFWDLVLFLYLEHISLFPNCTWLSVLVSKIATAFCLEGVTLCRWWFFSFTCALVIGYVLNFCDGLNCLIYYWYAPPHFWLCARPVCDPREGISFSTSFRLMKIRPSGDSFLSMQIYSVLWGHNPKCYWPPDWEIWRCDLGNHCDNWDSRWVYKLLSGRSH